MLEGGDSVWSYAELNGVCGYIPCSYYKEIVPSPVPIRTPPTAPKPQARVNQDEYDIQANNIPFPPPAPKPPTTSKPSTSKPPITAKPSILSLSGGAPPPPPLPASSSSTSSGSADRGGLLSSISGFSKGGLRKGIETLHLDVVTYL